MQLKGLVKLFTAALILISLYQISYTFVVRNVEQKLYAKATKQVKASHPEAQGAKLQHLIDDRYQAITDSVQGEKIVNMGLFKTTYAEAKQQELNLGLDLQGGMNVTLDVSLDDLMRSLSNNPQDPALNKAIETASKNKGNSDRDYARLFREAFEQQNPGVKMAYLFAKPNTGNSKDALTFNSTNDEVEGYIRRMGNEAIGSTYNVLMQRIDKFGVSQPNISLDRNRGIITVELAGVRNPERVREFLQSTAKLQFFETYTNAEIYQTLEAANDALVAYLSGTKALETPATDTAATQTTDTATGAVAATDGAADTGGIFNLNTDGGATAAAGTDSTALLQAEAEQKYPLLTKMMIPEQLQQRPGPVVAYVAKKDTAELNRYLALDVVKNKFPSNVRFMYGAENRESKFDSKSPLALYAIKTAPGTEGGARLEGDRVTDASMDYDPLTGKPVVLMSMDATGGRIWKKMTGDNVGRSVAVVLDNKVYSAPNVENEIAGGRTSISGQFTPEEATDLANILKIGKLPAPARIVQEQVVGPTLGAENIAAGMNSLLIAFVVIFALMLLYYNTSGIIANIALILNVFFTIGILSALHATLTMPGIAGLVLTIGMAVDTNVIIFERIKEELSSGKGYAQAVEDGYKRSYAPVLDGHITSLLTAVILFIAGLGPVKGFATTQIIGLLLSLYCGILVSRLITDMWMKKGRHFNYFTGISKKLFRKANFHFIEFRKVTYGIMVVVFLLGIGSFFNGFDHGVEFAGGRTFTVHFDQKRSENDVRETLKGHLNGERPIVKTVGQGNDLSITTTYMITENSRVADSQVVRTLYKGLSEGGLISAKNFDEFFTNNLMSQQKVEPSISESLKNDAIKATLIGMLAIFLYILLRFRKWQYSLGAIISLLHDVCIILAVFSFLRGVMPFSLDLDQQFIAAILTVIGFSINDTVIVFDRMRENFRKNPGMAKIPLINMSINQTLSRTVMTSATVFLTVLILFIFGGEVTRGFAFAMLIGVLTGTYSSIFIAAPILVDMDKKDKLKNEVDREARIEELKKLA